MITKTNEDKVFVELHDGGEPLITEIVKSSIYGCFWIDFTPEEARKLAQELNELADKVENK